MKDGKPYGNWQRIRGFRAPDYSFFPEYAPLLLSLDLMTCGLAGFSLNVHCPSQPCQPFAEILTGHFIKNEN